MAGAPDLEQCNTWDGILYIPFPSISFFNGDCVTVTPRKYSLRGSGRRRSHCAFPFLRFYFSSSLKNQSKTWCALFFESPAILERLFPCVSPPFKRRLSCLSPYHRPSDSVITPLLSLCHPVWRFEKFLPPLPDRFFFQPYCLEFTFDLFFPPWTWVPVTVGLLTVIFRCPFPSLPAVWLHIRFELPLFRFF